MINELLNPGAYQLPEDCTAFVRNGSVIVRKKRIFEPTRKCGECKHFGTGRVNYNDEPTRDVCLLRPKYNAPSSNYPKHIASQQRYYAAYRWGRICDRFEPKNDNDNERD